MIKRILVALSGTPYTMIAIQHALELATRHEAEITGVTITDLNAMSNVGPVPIGGAAAAAELVHHRQEVTEERVAQAIGDFESACGQAGIDHQVAHESGDPFEELMSLWRYHDLTILGLRGMFEYGVVHNPDDNLVRLVREGIRPLLVVSEQYHQINRALIAYDGSLHAAKAMKRFVQMRLWDDMTLKIVCFDKSSEDADPLLESAGTYCRAHGFDVETEAFESPAKESLLSQAEQWRADLIVIGASHKSRMARFVLGDLCLHTIRNAHIPLYLTR